MSCPNCNCNQGRECDSSMPVWYYVIGIGAVLAAWTIVAVVEAMPHWIGG